MKVPLDGDRTVVQQCGRGAKRGDNMVPETQLHHVIQGCKQRLLMRPCSIKAEQMVPELRMAYRCFGGDGRVDAWRSVAQRTRAGYGYEDCWYFEKLDLSDYSVGMDNALQIMKDVNRSGTVWDDFEDKSVWISKIERVLKALAVHYKEEGYTQGMNLLVSEMLFITRCEEDSFWLLVFISDVIIPRYFTRYMTGVKCDVWVIQQLLLQHFPLIVQHFKSVGCDMSFILLRPLLSLFSSHLIGESLYGFYDIMFTNPITTVFAAWMAFFDSNAVNFMEQNNLMEMMEALNSALESWADESLMESFLNGVLKWTVILDATTIEGLRNNAPIQWVNIELLIKARIARRSTNTSSDKSQKPKLARSPSTSKNLYLKVVWIASNLRTRFWNKKCESFRCEAVSICKEIMALNGHENILLGDDSSHHLDKICSPLLPPEGQPVPLDNKDMARTASLWAVADNFSATRALVEGLIASLNQLVEEMESFPGYVSILVSLEETLSKLGNSFPIFEHATAVINAACLFAESPRPPSKKWQFWKRDALSKMFNLKNQNVDVVKEGLWRRVVAFLLLRKLHLENMAIDLYASAPEGAGLLQTYTGLLDAILEDLCLHPLVVTQDVNKFKSLLTVHLFSWNSTIEDSLFLDKWQQAYLESVAGGNLYMSPVSSNCSKSHRMSKSLGGLEPNDTFERSLTSSGVISEITKLCRLKYLSNDEFINVTLQNVKTVANTCKIQVLSMYWALRNNYHIVQQVQKLLDMKLHYEALVQTIAQHLHEYSFQMQVCLSETFKIEFISMDLQRIQLLLKEKQEDEPADESEARLTVLDDVQKQVGALKCHTAWKWYLSSQIDGIRNDMMFDEL